MPIQPNGRPAVIQPMSLTPHYARIEQELLDGIRRGDLPPGAQLPTEKELSEQFKVSRITAKRVLDDLVQLGMAYRQQGRGTFVSQPKIREISGFVSFSEDMKSRGLTPSSKILLFEEINPDSEVCQRLKLNEGERIYRLQRIRFADDKPVALETAHLPARLYPGLLKEDLESGSLYAALRDKYHVRPAWADAEIEAATASRMEARHLDLKTGAPVLVARRLTYSESFEVIETVRSVYRGDSFTFYTGRQNIG